MEATVVETGETSRFRRFWRKLEIRATRSNMGRAVLPIRTIAVAGVLLFAGFQFTLANDEKNAASDNAPLLTVKLLDEAGAVVAGARAGLFVILRDGKWNYVDGVESDSEGIVRFNQGGARFKNQPVIYVRHAERHLVCLGDFADQNLVTVVELTMHPECHVTAKLCSRELEQRNRKLERPLGGFVKGTLNRFWCYAGADSIVHAFLPPGDYHIGCTGGKCASRSQPFTIESGARKLDLGTIDLPASRLEMLEGMPAPELAGIVEWKNGPAVTLSELRGKVVLLDFWGWWCGPCVHRGIPELFQLQDEFPGTDLAIVGIHTPSDETDEINSVAKLDAKLSKVRETVWKGRYIEFPVAMTQFQKGSYYEGGPEYATSKLCADYGIDSFPTAVLIDRQGNVIGAFDPSKPEEREKLKAMLNSK